MLNENRPRGSAEGAIPYDWRAQGLDFTRHYNIKDEDKPYIDRIVDVFMYDANTHTHCCEVTPSYWMMWLYTFVVWKGEPSEEVRERIDARYCHEAADDCYMHVAGVQMLTDFAASYDGQDAKDITEDDIREYWSGNVPV